MSWGLLLVLSALVVLLLLPAVLLALFLRVAAAPARGPTRGPTFARATAPPPRLRLLGGQDLLAAAPEASSGGRKVS